MYFENISIKAAKSPRKWLHSFCKINQNFIAIVVVYYVYYQTLDSTKLKNAICSSLGRILFFKQKKLRLSHMYS